MAPPDPEIHVYTADEVAELLGVDRKTVYQAAHRNEIPHPRPAHRLIFERGPVLASLRQGSAISNPKRGRDER